MTDYLDKELSLAMELARDELIVCKWKTLTKSVQKRAGLAKEPKRMYIIWARKQMDMWYQDSRLVQ